jgi:hypothetical protein
MPVQVVSGYALHNLDRHSEREEFSQTKLNEPDRSLAIKTGHIDLLRTEQKTIAAHREGAGHERI